MGVDKALETHAHVLHVLTGEEVSIDKQVACEECPRWLKMTEVACEKTEVAVC